MAIPFASFAMTEPLIGTTTNTRTETFTSTTTNSHRISSTTPTYTVTIVKYIDGHAATPESAKGATFPMLSYWSAHNIGYNHGTYNLGPSGFNSPTPYTAVTTAMSVHGRYVTREAASWAKTGVLVSGNCRNDDTYMVEGYSVGNSLAEAQAAGPTKESWVRVTDLTNDKYIIIWNRHCLAAPHNVSPKNGSKLTSAAWTKADWSDVTSPYGTVSYLYESSNSNTANPDGSFKNTTFKSAPLTVSEISTAGTAPGLYYWHVKAVDSAGNSSWWGNPFKTRVVP
jgi:hypothetical protein